MNNVSTHSSNGTCLNTPAQALNMLSRPGQLAARLPGTGQLGVERGHERLRPLRPVEQRLAVARPGGRNESSWPTSSSLRTQITCTHWHSFGRLEAVERQSHRGAPRVRLCTLILHCWQALSLLSNSASGERGCTEVLQRPPRGIRGPHGAGRLRWPAQAVSSFQCTVVYARRAVPLGVRGSARPEWSGAGGVVTDVGSRYRLARSCWSVDSRRAPRRCPHRLPQQVLHAIRCRVTGVLGDHPAVLPL